MSATTQNNESDILQLLQKGNIDAYVQLYNRYHGQLYSYILQFVKVPSVAEDILQDVFLKIWELHAGIKPELNFKAYLYKISRNKVFKHFQQLGNNQQMRIQLLYHLPKYISDSDLQLAWQQYEQLLHNAITQLPPQRQKIFKLCREENMTYAQVSQQLGISTNTVKEHMVLAMKSIKEQLGRNEQNIFAVASLLLYIHELSVS